eukprot:5275875-Pyramimonas_sp.AAC.1
MLHGNPAPNAQQLPLAPPSNLECWGLVGVRPLAAPLRYSAPAYRYTQLLRVWSRISVQH